MAEEQAKFTTRAVIFDMDGVLVDSEQWWQKFEMEFLRSHIPQWNEKLTHHL